MSRLENDSNIEQALRQFWAPIPADLLDAFYAYQWQHYRHFLLFVNLLAQAAYFSYGLVDALILPDIAWLAIGVRLFLLIVTLPIVVAASAWFAILVRTTSPKVTVYE